MPPKLRNCDIIWAC